MSNKACYNYNYSAVGRVILDVGRVLTRQVGLKSDLRIYIQIKKITS